MKKFSAALAACVALAVISCQSPEEIDLLVVNARIYSLDDEFNTYSAMAVQEGRVLALGAGAELEEKYQAKQYLDLRGGALYPAFNDAHAHLAAYAQISEGLDLNGVGSYAELLERAASYQAARQVSFIRGRGWDQNLWPGQKMPDKSGLDSLFPNTPVLFQRVDGHAALVNSAALRYAGIDANTQVEGGRIERRNGEATGLLIDHAVDLVKFPPPSDEDWLRNLKEQEVLAFSLGITSVTEAGLRKAQLQSLEQFMEAGELQLRYNIMLADDSATLAHYLPQGPRRDPRLRWQSVKFFLDGALGSRGALLLAPYADDSANLGLQLHSRAHFQFWADSLDASNWQMCTHAIGDSANRLIIEVYRQALGASRDHRWRIEHAQIVHPEDRAKLLEAGIIPSIQPTHALSDLAWAEERLGPERLRYAYPGGDFLPASALPLGTDYPVEALNPMRTLYTALFRLDASGEALPEKGSDQRLNFEQALRGMTEAGAYASFEEEYKGRLSPGYLADFVVFEKDLAEMSPQELLAAQPWYTYREGLRVYKKPL